MIEIKKFTFNPVGVNGYVLWDETKEALLIDTACSTGAEESQLTGFIREKGLKPVQMVNTHGHFDHLMGNGFVFETYGLKSAIHQGDLELAQQASSQSALFGIDMDEVPAFGRIISNGDRIAFGKSSVEVIHVPGHSPGCVALYSEASGVLFTGDILFCGSIGRTDLPGGDYHQLIRGIREKLLVLPDQVVVYAGHGQESTIGNEREENPFLGE